MRDRSPDNLDPFITDLRLELEAAGLHDPARRLAEVQNAVYTTSGEWLAEVQLAVKQIRRQHRIPPALDVRLRRLLEPPYAERVQRRQYWEVVFYSTVVLMLLMAIAVLALLKTDDFEQYGWVWMVLAGGVAAALWISVRKISVCPGCRLRSQHPALAYCAFCGMRRYSGLPGPRLTPDLAASPSTLLLCPICKNPPGGRTRYGRPIPSEGQFCGFCGCHLSSVSIDTEKA